jgi:hypothetical protein
MGAFSSASTAAARPESRLQVAQPLPSTAARWLVTALIIIQFFPIPPLPGLGVAPENLLFLFATLYLMGRVVKMLSRDKRILMLAFLFLGYTLLRAFHNLAHYGALVPPYEHIRTLIFILVLAEAGAHDVMLRRLLKLLLIIGAIQIVFGLLNYTFGGPFTLFRNWVRQVQFGDAVISKGSQIAGLYGAPHIFAYLLSVLPVLSIAMFFLERRIVWLGWMGLMLLGLFINAERAALAAVVFCSLIMVWKVSRASTAVFVLVVAGILVLSVQQVVEVLDPGEANAAGSAYVHGTLSERLGETTTEEVFGRVKYQFRAAASVFRHPLIGPSWPQFVREVLGKGSGELVGSGELESTMASHNHFVNLGLDAGIFGWVIGGWFLYILWRMHRISVERYRGQRAAYVRHAGIALAVLAAMINAFFHNAGVFSPELATSYLIGLLVADYRLAVRSGSRVVPDESGDLAGNDDEELDGKAEKLMAVSRQPIPRGV